MPPRSVLAAALLVGAVATTSAAQGWRPVGPPGGDVRSLAADPGQPAVVYLGTAHGHLYRSDDGGRAWHRLVPGFPLPGMSLDDLRVDSRGDVVVGFWEVSGSGGGVARSRDAGRSFEVLLQGVAVRALAVSATDPRVLVVGTPEGVLRSQDAGRSWQRLGSPGAGPTNVDSVAVDPDDPDLIYAGTWHLPWKTTDGGASWRRIRAGMMTDSDVMTLSFDSRDRQRLYATACTGVYRSSGGGEAWSRFTGIPWTARRTRAFAQDPARPDTLYAGTTQGLWRSDDDGRTWEQIGDDRLVVNAVLPLPGGVVLAGADGAGVLRSTDHGRSFQAANTGFSERFVSQVIFDSHGILAGIRGDRFHGGVYAATSPAGPWRRLGEGLQGREVLALAPGPPAVAGTDDGVFELDPSGRWHRLDTVVGGLEVHPRVVALATPEPGLLLAATSKGLLRSTDAGASWSRRELGLGGAATAVAASPKDPSLVVAASLLGIFASRDAGASWTPLSSGPGHRSVTGLGFLPASDRIVFAITRRGLYRSPDRGRTWYPLVRGLPPGGITALAFHPDGRHIFACDFTAGGLYRSADGGDTWTPFPTEGLASPRVWTLAVDPRDPDRLLAAAPAGGLHLWAPAGARATGGSSSP